MADRFTIEADTSELLAALDAIPDAILAHLKPVAKDSADHIAVETSRRFARRAAGPTRGGQHTAEGITVEETHDGTGYVVYVKSPEMPNLPDWLEFGTRFMQPHPALFPAAHLEEGSHDRRAREAVQSAIDEKGLGD